MYRFMSKQFIALFVYLSFALSSLFLPKNAWSYFEKKIKTGTVSVEVHLAFEKHTATEGRELYFRAVFIL